MKVSIIRCNQKMKLPIVGWLIRISQSFKWSHYAIGFEIDGIGFITDSNGHNGVNITTQSRWFEHYHVEKVDHVKLDCTREEFLYFINNKIGTKYGFLQVLGLLLIILRIVKKNPFKKGIICNEYVLLMLERFENINVEENNFAFNKTEMAISRVVNGHLEL